MLLGAGCFGGGQPATQVTPVGTAIQAPKPPAPSPSPSPSPSPTRAAGPEQSYTIDSGDTLLSISEKFYGDATLWRKIYDANRAAIGDDPDKLKVGTQIRIPPKD